jgi:hypothetical protein
MPLLLPLPAAPATTVLPPRFLLWCCCRASRSGAAATLPAVVLLPMTLRCRQAAKLATAAALLLP